MFDTLNFESIYVFGGVVFYDWSGSKLVNLIKNLLIQIKDHTVQESRVRRIFCQTDLK